MEFHFRRFGKKNYKDKKIRVAVAVNSRLTESDWKKKKILNGDKIEIVQPYFGG